MLPCGHSNPVRLSQLQGEARTRYALGTGYHTAYVMGFLCAASLRAGRTPPANIVGPQCEASCLDRLFRYVDDDQGHWRSEFTSLAQAEQRALAPLILDVAIVQKCRKHDYQAMSELVSLACEYRHRQLPHVRASRRTVGAHRGLLACHQPATPSNDAGGCALGTYGRDQAPGAGFHLRTRQLKHSEREWCKNSGHMTIRRRSAGGKQLGSRTPRVQPRPRPRRLLARIAASANVRRRRRAHRGVALSRTPRAPPKLRGRGDR